MPTKWNKNDILVTWFSNQKLSIINLCNSLQRENKNR